MSGHKDIPSSKRPSKCYYNHKFKALHLLIFFLFLWQYIILTILKYPADPNLDFQMLCIEEIDGFSDFR